MKFLLLLAIAAMLPLAGETVDVIVSRALIARGGADRIRAMRTQRLSGRISIASDAPGTLNVEIRRGGSIREEFIAGTAKIVRITDGRTGWLRVGEDAPVPIDPADIKSMANSADLDGPLLDYPQKGTRIEYAGIVQVRGRSAFKLVIQPKDVPQRIDYIDTVTYLELKWEGRITAEGKELMVESYFDDYREVNGIQCAFRIDSNTIGTPIKQKITFDRIEINTPIDDSRFQKP